jgi:hypothetical protein
VSDEIRLTLPRERPFFGIAHLVLGGLAVRLDLTFEILEDLQLALENLLGEAQVGGELTVTVRIEGDELHASVGPFTAEELARLGTGGEPGDATLGRVLDTVVDDVQIGERDGASWVDVTKTVRRAVA